MLIVIVAPWCSEAEWLCKMFALPVCCAGFPGCCPGSLRFRSVSGSLPVLDIKVAFGVFFEELLRIWGELGKVPDKLLATVIHMCLPHSPYIS